MIDAKKTNIHKSRTIGIVQPINIFAHFTLIHLFYQQSTFDCQWSKLMLFSHISYESESPNQLPKNDWKMKLIIFLAFLAPSQRVTCRLTLMLAMTMTGVACIHDFCWLLLLLPLFYLGICIFKKFHIGQQIYIVNIKINFVVGKHQR